MNFFRLGVSLRKKFKNVLNENGKNFIEERGGEGEGDGSAGWRSGAKKVLFKMMFESIIIVLKIEIKKISQDNK